MTLLARLREANATKSVEDSIPLRIAVFVAVMAATAAALDLGIGGDAAVLGCLVGIPAGYVLSHVLRDRDRGWLKVILAVFAIGAFWQFLGLMGPAFAGEVLGLQEGLVALFLWVQVLHSMDLPARRDLMFSLGASGSLLIVTAVLATTDRFGIALVVWLGASMAALVIATINDATAFPVVEGARRPRHGRALRGIPAWLAAVVLVGVLVMYVLPPAKVFSFGLPSRASADGIATGGRLVNPAALPSAAGSGGGKSGRFGYFGYLDTLDMGFRGRPDNTLVMKVRAAAPDFWRAQSFDRFDGQQWSSSDERLRLIRGNQPFVLYTPPEDAPTLAGDELIQIFFIERMAPNIIFAAASPKEVYWPYDAVFQLSDGTVRAGDTMEPGTVYSVVSRRVPVTAGMLRERDPRAGFVSAALLRRYTHLSANTPPRVRELARTIAASQPSTYDTVLAMQRWIGANTRYSLNPPRLGDGEDAVEQFLFEDRLGFCEQIASSLVVMLRAVGIPARLTVGYTPGTRNPFTGLYEVRASDAHAYTEVLFPGVGWQSFDPTANVPLAGEAGIRSAGAGSFSWLADKLPEPARAAGPLAVLASSGGAAWVATYVLRRRRRTWVDIEIARLEREAGVRLGRSETLPRWLERVDRPDLEPAVKQLEREAFGVRT